MRDDLVAFWRRNNLPPQLLAELEAIIEGRPVHPGSGAQFDRVETTNVVKQTAKAEVGVGYAPDSAPTLPVLGSPRRYEPIEPIGIGASGEVLRVRDYRLQRTVAMKILKPEGLTHARGISRFLSEARLCACLQHPGIVPIHDVGSLDDGRLFITMTEIRGRTLLDVIREVHEASADGTWQASACGWTLSRLVRALHRVCEAVAYAHGQGIIHRDLKPANIMVGDNDEVLVVDWGLALPMDPRGFDRRFTVSGTPAFMAPEQVVGDTDNIDAKTDVYALGGVLYQILVGQSPWAGVDASTVIQNVLTGANRPTTSLSSGPPPPRRLSDVCRHALAHDRDKRMDSVKMLAELLDSWLEGTRRGEEAQEFVEDARGLEQKALELRRRAQRLDLLGSESLRNVPTWATATHKRDGWKQQDEARRHRQRADALEVEAEHLLRTALIRSPSYTAAHVALAQRFQRDLADAEAHDDDDAAVRAELQLRRHVKALPVDSAERQFFAAYLDGSGSLALESNPPGAEVLVQRYVDVGRRLVPDPVMMPGTTPIDEIPLKHGSYLVILRRDGFDDVRYPVVIERGGNWVATPPGESERLPIPLLESGALGPLDLLVPGGWFMAGDKDDSLDPLDHRHVWVDDFVVRRYPVTNAEYVEFINDLLRQGREEEARRFAPGVTVNADDDTAAFSRDPSGPFVLAYTPEVLPPTSPVVLVDAVAAQAWCRWYSKLTAAEWRLPFELEWEKAARGVDGRAYPWGDFFDPSRCYMRESEEEPPKAPGAVGGFPDDESPYGVRGLAGNVREWCQDVYRKGGSDAVRLDVASSTEDETAQRVIRGGSWRSIARDCRLTARTHASPLYRAADLGFRPVRSLPKVGD